MKNLKIVSNQDLNNQLQKLVKNEREILSEILLHIAEADRRRLYLEYAYPSLFEYLTKHLGYSAGSAQRRIDSARLSKELPGLVESLEKGELNLSQISLLQKSVRQVEKINRTSDNVGEVFAKVSAKVPVDLKHQLVDQLKGKSFEDSQKIVARGLNLEIKAATLTTHQADESVRLELSLSKVQWQKLLKMRDLLSHSLPSGSWDEVMEYVADKVIASKTKSNVRVKEGRIKDTRMRQTHAMKLESEKSVPLKQEVRTRVLVIQRRAAIPERLKRKILGENACCQYKSPITQKRCASTWQLQVHHLKPVWAGGSNALENLNILCGQHNRHVYRAEAGIRFR